MKYYICQTPDSFTTDSALIVPIGLLDKSLLENLAKVLEERFIIKFFIKEPLEIPKEAFNPKRSQFEPTKIFNILKGFKGNKVLGVIDKDLYTQGLNFIFGQAELPGRCALISITRLRQEFYGLPKDEKILFKRVIKEAIHELGHTYGIKHCLNKDCVMYFSNSIIDTDKKSVFFCNICQKK